MITLDTAAALEALALQIFNSHIDLGVDPVASQATGLKAEDPVTSAQYYALIAPVMLAIDGRVMEPGVRYTLNFTCALKGRPRHWFIAYASEYNTANPGTSWLWPAQTGLVFTPDQPYGFAGGVNSYGYTLALATCASILHAWAAIVRMWLSGNYPLAVTLP